LGSEMVLGETPLLSAAKEASTIKNCVNTIQNRLQKPANFLVLAAGMTADQATGSTPRILE
jgi:hypothetical protein